MFDGQYHSHEGSQFIGNSFSTTGPIYFDSNSDNRLPTSVCEVPDLLLSPHFTGRSNELEQIEQAFDDVHNDVHNDVPVRCVVHGMPGLGKTQLVLKYATLAFKESRYCYVFWVTAASVETLNRDFTKLVHLLHLPGRHSLDQVAKSTVVRAWLEDTADARSWLLVVDNVNQETAASLRDILPRRNNLGKFLFTTRTEKVADSLLMVPARVHKIALQPPSIDDAITMLFADAKREGEYLDQASLTDIESLIKSVGSLPLAINQAASYMRETGSSAKDILDIYRNEEVDEILSWENDLSQHEERSVAATFAPACKQLERDMPDAITLLRLLSFFNPESIPISILKQGSESLKRCGSTEMESNQSLNTAVALLRSSARLSKAIQEIQRLSLVVQRLERSDRIIWIHDLVQLLLRLKLMANTERAQWLEIAICITCKAFQDIGDRRSPQNWILCSQYVTHIQTMERFAEQYDLKSVELMDASTWAAIYFQECGLYQEAASINKRVWDKRKNVLGAEHPSTLISMANLASTYRNQGRWKEAEELDVQVMKMRSRVLEAEHPHTLSSMANLASTYWNQGRWKEAEELEVQVMKMRKRVLGAEHPSTLISMANLASTYRNQGRWKEAEELDVQVMKMSSRVLGAEHPDTLSSMANLASTYQDQGRWKEAEELEVQVMKMSSRVLGAEHPDTLTSMNNLAHTYRSQSRNDEAIGMMKMVVTLRAKVIGTDHPHTAAAMDYLRSWTVT